MLGNEETPPSTFHGTPGPAPGVAGLTTTLIVIAAIAALYFGRDLFIPFALALLLSFALAPLTRRLRGLGLGRVPSVLVAVAVAFAIIAGIAVVVGAQLVQLATNLPSYQQNIERKIEQLRPDTGGGGVLGRAATMFRELQTEIAEQSEQQAAAESQARQRPPPLRVQVEEPPPTPLDVIENIAVPLMAPVVTAGLVVVFLIFMLLERDNLRDRFIALVGHRDLRVTTEALDEAAHRVSRYLLMQLVVNATYGIPVGIGLWLIGVPNAVLWGVLAIVLRFLPYVGPFIAALFPVTLAVAVDPGWTMVFWTVALIVTLELISNNFIEPWLYGASTGISAIAVILAAIFWTTLWGPVGLFLATPLTVCLSVVGRHVPTLRFFDVLLGSEPVLAPEERLYQRMLAGEAEEAGEIAEKFLQEKPLIAFCEEVMLPALRLAEKDRQRKALGGERLAVVTESFLALVRDLADYDEPETRESDEQPHPTEAAVAWTGQALCVGARSGLDTVSAALLVHVLERRGIGARLAPREALSAEALGSLNWTGVEMVCLLYLSPSGPTHARGHCRRLRRVARQTPRLVALLNAPPGAPPPDTTGIDADVIATAFSQVVTEIERRATGAIDAPMEPAPIPSFEKERLAELERLRALAVVPSPPLEKITRELADSFGVSISLVSLIDREHQVWPGASGLPEDLDKARAAPRETSICGHVVAANEPLVIEDTLKDKRFANNPFLRERGIRFYAGAPLRTSSGQPIGSLCVIDTKPRTISKSELALLRLQADRVVAELEQQARATPPGEKAPPNVGAAR